MADSHSNAGHDAQGDAPLDEIRLVADYTDGGHEIDEPPSAMLFVFLFALVAIVVGSGFGVYQLFVADAEDKLSDAYSRPAVVRLAQERKDRDTLGSYGVVTFDGKQVGFRMPIAQARALVLEDAKRFAPAAPPEGWTHPDDVQPAPTEPAPTDN